MNVDVDANGKNVLTPKRNGRKIISRISARIGSKQKTCPAIRKKKPQQNFNEDLHKY